MPHIPISAILLDRGFNFARVISMLKRLKLGYLVIWKKHNWHWQIFESMSKKKFLSIGTFNSIKDDDKGRDVVIKNWDDVVKV